MGIVSWIILGLIAGTIARLLHPGRDPGGCLITILFGIGGALVGGFIGTTLGWGRVNGFDLRSLGLAVLGSLILLIAYRTLFGKKRRR
jgi:uncharacterized membrane protein YeaQ/YmgE (transglycosylase-associated protein family)